VVFLSLVVFPGTQQWMSYQTGDFLFSCFSRQESDCPIASVYTLIQGTMNISLYLAKRNEGASDFMN
jgi:hypothetical protein